MALGDAAFSNQDIMRRLRALENELRELRSARGLESSTIGDGGLRVRGDGGITVQNGGGLTVEDGGDIDIVDSGRLRLTTTDGVRVVDIGPNATGKQALVLRRDDGSLMFFTGSNGVRDFWSFTDNTGDIIVSDDAVAGVGMARPWLPVTMYPLFAPPSGVYAYRTVDASLIGTEKLLWEGRAWVSHPRITIDGVWGRASGTNNSTYRLVVGGVEVGTWNETTLNPGQRGPFSVQSQVNDAFVPVQVYARATSGTGPVAAQVLGCYLRQS